MRLGALEAIWGRSTRDKKRNAQGKHFRPVNTNAMTAEAWRVGILAAIEEAEALRFAVDVDLDVEIERIRASVPELSFELELVASWSGERSLKIQHGPSESRPGGRWMFRFGGHKMSGKPSEV